MTERAFSLPALHLFLSLVTERKLLLFPDKATPPLCATVKTHLLPSAHFIHLRPAELPICVFPSTALFFSSPVFVPLLRLTLHPSHPNFIKEKSDKTVHPRTQGYKLGCVCVCVFVRRGQAVYQQPRTHCRLLLRLHSAAQFFVSRHRRGTGRVWGFGTPNFSAFRG